MMDDVIARPRYARNSAAIRRRRRSQKNASMSMAEKLVLKIIVCLAILVVVGLIRSINTPVTNFLSDKLKAAILHEVDLKGIYQWVDGALANLGIDKKSEEGEHDTPVGGNIPDDVSGDDSNRYGLDPGGYDYLEETGNDTSKKVELASAEVLETIRENYEFITPVDGVVVSGFGSISNEERDDKFHTGIDMETKNGEAVKSALDGEVALVSISPEYGKYVVIDHGGGLSTKYAHCWHILVQEGQQVQAGEVIAEVGNSGVSVGSHLHFEILKDGKYLDPMDLLKVQVE
ncbi:M23 family metallopeptidase [Pseudoclostridium thermosuccinogenes]|uniref:M23 family metallopeptidase n=1 Tax=Clostridium thermosuccinogenes TaxID=84032 RepID=UPI002FDB177F